MSRIVINLERKSVIRLITKLIHLCIYKSYKFRKPIIILSCLHIVTIVIQQSPSNRNKIKYLPTALCTTSIWNMFQAISKSRTDDKFLLFAGFHTCSDCGHLASDTQNPTAATFSRWFLARGFFYPEGGGDRFLRNVSSHKIYTAPHPRRRHSS
jgi:hypothetical protein